MEETRRLKRILEQNTDNDSEVYEVALRHLRMVEMTPEILVATGISRVVASIRRDTGDLEIEYLATKLYRNWRRIFRGDQRRSEVVSSSNLPFNPESFIDGSSTKEIPLTNISLPEVDSDSDTIIVD